MRERDKIVGNLESLYRDAFDRAREDEEEDRMERLDFRFQRDQLFLEALLDVRDLLAAVPGDEEGSESLLEKAEALRRLTRLR